MSMDDRNRRTALAAMFVLPVGMAMASQASAASKGKKPMDMAQRLDVIESKQAITELLYAYARANDRADEALLKSCFWPESTHKHGKFEGKSLDFVGFAFKIVATLKYACHHISNVAVEVQGDRAFSECYYFAQHRRDRKEGGGEEDVFFQGRYLDDLERRNGEWRIIRRRGLSDYTSPPQPAATPYADWPAGQHSEKFPSDDYYRMRQQYMGV
ncbi:nuclear transport factor 2 family protein [Sphingobium sp. KCTC 72723]|uniref:nuclear transport factor 2 family protein n=1 Tax=Sphingobium sp. KCTC 72723 TaxID=2733867 RepID=UPI0021D27B76|nr:nuclear transport factor 2 family protein [Sphingobium sp. KCTC 72723]